jgi:hypothetical protein
LKIRALQEGVGGTFVADGRGGLRTVIVAGVDFHPVIELQDNLEQAVELIFRTRPPRKRAPDTPHEQGIAGHQLAIDQHTHRVQIMPRREQDLNTLLAELNDIAMVQLDVRVDTCLFVSR